MIIKILDFLNVLDDSGRLSITNIAAMSLIAKLVFTSNPDLSTIGATAVGILNYMHKRQVISRSNDDTRSNSSEPSA